MRFRNQLAPWIQHNTRQSTSTTTTTVVKLKIDFTECLSQFNAMLLMADVFKMIYILLDTNKVVTMFDIENHFNNTEESSF